jgi:hypothetical protein
VIALISSCVVAGLGTSLLPGLLSRKKCARFNRDFPFESKHWCSSRRRVTPSRPWPHQSLDRGLVAVRGRVVRLP